LIVRSKGDMAK